MYRNYGEIDSMSIMSISVLAKLQMLSKMLIVTYLLFVKFDNKANHFSQTLINCDNVVQYAKHNEVNIQ